MSMGVSALCALVHYTDRIEAYEGTLGDAALTHGPHLLLR